MKNVGIIGCGAVGQKRAKQLAGASLYYVCDTNVDKMATILNCTKMCWATSDWETVVNFKDIDIVIVATTHNMLAPITKAAIIAGKHVLVEKPVGMNIEEIQELVELRDKYNVKVHVGFNLRFHPAIQRAYYLYDEVNSIGNIMYTRCIYGHGGRKGYDLEWRANPNFAGGGSLVEQGIHCIDLARMFLGHFEKVDGFNKTYFWDQKFDDNAFLTLRTKDDKVAFIHTSSTEWKNKFCLEIFGDNGKLQIDGLGGSYGVEKLTLYTIPAVFGPPITHSWEYPQEDKSWNTEFEYFLSNIEKGINDDTLEDCVEHWKVINRIYKKGE